jgi:hypothetical protein
VDVSHHARLRIPLSPPNQACVPCMSVSSVSSRRCSYMKLSPRLKVGLILETLISWDDTTSRVGQGLDTGEAAS